MGNDGLSSSSCRFCDAGTIGRRYPKTGVSFRVETGMKTGTDFGLKLFRNWLDQTSLTSKWEIGVKPARWRTASFPPSSPKSLY